MSEETQGTAQWQGPITDPGERSLVAAFIAQWELEVAAMQCVFSGYSEGTAQHDAIIKRMELAGGRCQPYLATIEATQQAQKDALKSSTTTTA